jgi:uncharacterized protein
VSPFASPSSAADGTTLALGEFHRFESNGLPFVYLVPSGAVFALDTAADAVLGFLADGPRSREALAQALTPQLPAVTVEETLGELVQLRAVVARTAKDLSRADPGQAPGESPLSPGAARPVNGPANATTAAHAAAAAKASAAAALSAEPGLMPVTTRPASGDARSGKVIPLIPLQTLVLNVTNKCNLACAYCYEYGEDRIPGSTAHGTATPAVPAKTAPKFMTRETARESVELALRESGTSPVVNITFFGGETLLNFAVLQDTITYARHRASQVGKRVEFSLTTNGTLLRPDIIEFLADQQIGVTISIDGPKELQNKFRVFHDGGGSYDIVVPKIKELLKRHTSRPIGARVTLTAQVNDVQRIYRHLTEEIGFHEVGFAPVTSSLGRAWAMSEQGLDHMLKQFETLAHEWMEAALVNRHHGFSNIKETIEEIHQGQSKAYPCGAGFGLMGVATDGEVSLCHRFAGSDAHRLGSVTDGIDRDAQMAFLESHHVGHKVDCSTCWARPLCAGGCYHEAHTRYGDTAAPNLHFCDWIRGWTDLGLRIYGELASRHPAFLSRFDRQGQDSQVSHETPHVN